MTGTSELPGGLNPGQPAPAAGHGMLLEGRVALVTGAARGLGLSIARVLAQQGARVVLNDLDGECLEQSAKQMSAAGQDVRTATGNVAVVADCERMVQTALDSFGRLDILVNNAGGSAYTPRNIEEVTEDAFDKVMDWNVRGTFFSTKAALPALKVRGGVVINLTSLAGQIGSTTWSPQYSAAKAAIIALTRNLAKHLGQHGIRVNAVGPGFISTGGRADEIWNTRDNAQILQTIALGRRGDMDDLSEVVLFLASDQARYVTGSVINSDGGYLAA